MSIGNYSRAETAPRPLNPDKSPSRIRSISGFNDKFIASPDTPQLIKNKEDYDSTSKNSNDFSNIRIPILLELHNNIYKYED